jgi:hypothetical protein
MRKHLFSFIAAVGVLFAGAGTAWADTTVGLYRTVTDSKIGAFQFTETTLDADGISVEQNFGSNLGAMKSSGRNVRIKGVECSFDATSANTSSDGTQVYRTKCADGNEIGNEYQSAAYWGYTVNITTGKRLNVSKLDAEIGVSFNNFIWKVQIESAAGTVLYQSADNTVSSYDSSTDYKGTTLSATPNVYIEDGSTVKLYFKISSGTSKYITPINLKITGELVAAATKCESPVLKLGNYDKTTQTYPLTITSTDDSDIYYSLNNAAAVKYEGTALTVTPGDKIVAHCEKSGLTNSDDETLEVPSLVSYTETTSAGTAEQPLTGTSYTINGAASGSERYNGGPGSGDYKTYIKMRTTQTAGSVKGFRIAVNEGYTILKIEGNGYANSGSVSTTDDDGNTTKTSVYGDIQIKGVYVDGGDNTLTDETIVTLPKSSDGKTVSFTFDNLNAKQYIDFECYTETSNINQAILKFTITYKVNDQLVTMSSVGYSTLYSESALQIPANIQVYTGTVSGDVLNLKEVTTVIPAKTPVILVGTADKTYTFNVSDDTSDPITSSLQGTASEIATSDITSGTVYTLAYKTDASDVGFYKFTGEKLAAGKAYLVVANKDAAPAVRFNFGETDEPGNVTGINAVTIENRSENVIYDLRGRRVLNLDRPGLYIVNGKKVAIQ